MSISLRVSFVMTISIADMIEQGEITNESIATICDYSVTYFPTSYMLCFIPQGEYTTITDGNDNVLTTISLKIPQTIWAMSDEYQNEIIGTIMLPSDY